MKIVGVRKAKTPLEKGGPGVSFMQCKYKKLSKNDLQFLRVIRLFHNIPIQVCNNMPKVSSILFLRQWVLNAAITPSFTSSELIAPKNNKNVAYIFHFSFQIQTLKNFILQSFAN